MASRSKVLAGIGLAAAGLLGASAASGNVLIGSPSNGGCYPFKCNDSGTSSGETMDYQQVYSASAFSGPTSIIGLTFFDYTDFNPGQPVLNGQYIVMLGTVVGGVGSTNLVTLSNAQVIFSGALGGEIGDFTLSGAGYQYDPSQGDLVMEVLAFYQDNVPNGSGNGYFQTEDPSSLMSVAVNIPGVGTGAANFGLVTQFDTGTIAVPAPEPATWAMMLMGFGGVGAGMRKARRKTASVGA